MKQVMELEITRVLPEEIAVLQAVSKQTFFDTFAVHNRKEDMDRYLEESFSHHKLMSELREPYSAFYFARVNNRVVGYLKINTASSQTERKNDNSLEIERLYVLHEFHGRQVGQQLFDKAIEIAHAQDVDYVWLGVWEKNARALRFYEKNGFTPFDQHIFRLGDDEQTDIMVKKTLKQ
jgi:ribosomal protein S18 acetylase RimI-like enzyme